MVFKTKNGRLVDDDELNELSALEIEELGVHASPSWDEWN